MTINAEKDIKKPYVRPMPLHWREMFTSKVDAAMRCDRWDFIALEHRCDHHRLGLRA